MTSYGAKVIRGGDQEALLRQLLERSNHYPCTIFCPRAGYSNPFGVEGFKTIAFKIYEQLGRSAPDRVFVPTGSGDGIYGVWKPLRELRDLGWIAKGAEDDCLPGFRRGFRISRVPTKSASCRDVPFHVDRRITGSGTDHRRPRPASRV